VSIGSLSTNVETIRKARVFNFKPILFSSANRRRRFPFEKQSCFTCVKSSMWAFGRTLILRVSRIEFNFTQRISTIVLVSNREHFLFSFSAQYNWFGHSLSNIIIGFVFRLLFVTVSYNSIIENAFIIYQNPSRPTNMYDTHALTSVTLRRPFIYYVR